LKTKAFLKTRSVVLVDAGHRYAHLEQLCRSLEANGFEDVAILDGGLNVWWRHVGPLEGSRGAQRELVRISPAQFFREGRFSHWKVVDLGPEPEARVSIGDVPTAVSAPRAGRGEMRDRLLQAKGAAGRQDPEPYLLVVTEEGAGFDEFLAALRGTELVHAYFLEGGRKGYERFVRSQQAMMSYRHRIPNRKGCRVVE